MDITVGLTGTAEMVVTARDTADAIGSGDVPVLATPRLVALLEAATCDALADVVSDTHTSVGVAVDVRHQRPTPPGLRVCADARVVEVDGARVVFEVTAAHHNGSDDEVEVIGGGTITRAVVERARFLPG